MTVNEKRCHRISKQRLLQAINPLQQPQQHALREIRIEVNKLPHCQALGHCSHPRGPP